MKLKILKIVDLFSGLGGASQAFVDRGHNVTRYDNDERFRNVPFTIIKDVRLLHVAEFTDVDFVFIGFPCQHFSIAAVQYHWPRGIPTNDTRAWIEFLKWIIDLVKRVDPPYWILENPMGMMRNVIGKPARTTFWAAWGTNWLKPTDLWGKLPPIDWKTKECATWEKAPRGSNKGLQGLTRVPAKRALIPYDFSLAVCLAVEGKSPQTTLEQFRTFKEGNNTLPRRVE